MLTTDVEPKPINRHWQRALWRELRNYNEHLTEAQLRVMIFALQNNYMVPDYMHYNEAINNWLQDGANANQIEQYRQLLQECKITPVQAIAFKLAYMDALLEDKNCYYILKEHRLVTSAIIGFICCNIENEQPKYLLTKLNIIDRHMIDIFFNEENLSILSLDDILLKIINTHINDLNTLNNRFINAAPEERQKIIDGFLLGDAAIESSYAHGYKL